MDFLCFFSFFGFFENISKTWVKNWLATADKNFGADDKAHTVDESKHSPHGTYEVYDHSFSATINALDNTERYISWLNISFKKQRLPVLPTTVLSSNKLSQNQQSAPSRTRPCLIRCECPLELQSMAFKRDSF